MAARLVVTENGRVCRIAMEKRFEIAPSRNVRDSIKQ